MDSVICTLLSLAQHHTFYFRPTQGFVEITIKDLENMLHVEVSKLWSKGLIQCFTNSKAKYDVASNSLTKSAEALKIDDKILRRVDPEGRPSKEYYSWKIVDLVHTQALGPENSSSLLTSIPLTFIIPRVFNFLVPPAFLDSAFILAIPTI